MIAAVAAAAAEVEEHWPAGSSGSCNQRWRGRRRRRPSAAASASALVAAVVVVATLAGTACAAEASIPQAASAAPPPPIKPAPPTVTTTTTIPEMASAAWRHALRLARLPPGAALGELATLAQRNQPLVSEWVAAHRPHLALEAALLLVILLVLRRDRSRPARARGADADCGADDALTEREVDALCAEWRPEPLVPPSSILPPGGADNTNSPPPSHLPDPPALDEWRGSHSCVVRGRACLNLASADFLALGDAPAVRSAARSTIERYGVGSCGPRGFYGTFDVHLELEAALASFLGAEEGIVYPYDLATLASVIPACASRADVLVLDEGCGFAIQQGALLSRARTHWFRHNDVADLARVLELADSAADGGGRKGGGKGGGANATNSNDAADADAGKPKRRKMIVVEGVYANSGDAAPLRAIWELKEKHRYRLCVDESSALGVLGPTGRGACEAAGLKPGSDVEVVCGTLGAALASVGGFCVGYHEVVDPQRLSGSGYCFSASLPPYLAAAAAAALGELSTPAGAEKAARARRAARRLRAALRASKPRGMRLPECSCDADEEAPLLHLQASPELMARALEREQKKTGRENAASASAGDALAAAAVAARRAVERALYDVQSRLISEHGVLVALPRYSPLERRLPPPSLKLHAHAGLLVAGGGAAGAAEGAAGAAAGGDGKELEDGSEVERVARAVAEACEAVLGERFF
jgi:serine palmitoyltransferase